MSDSLVPRSLVWATSIDVLPPQRVVHRRDGYLAVRSPTNPTHFWGNLLVFDDAPAPGDGEPWEAIFAAEFAMSRGCGTAPSPGTGPTTNVVR